mmetsp:Transcript_5039/g.12789  ORF Transcript_5039/g.12789 Transcript_5039/m.12789 type:complete len:227 (+) Transcript_5039:1216-1896(+)
MKVVTDRDERDVQRRLDVEERHGVLWTWPRPILLDREVEHEQHRLEEELLSLFLLYVETRWIIPALVLQRMHCATATADRDNDKHVAIPRVPLHGHLGVLLRKLLVEDSPAQPSPILDQVIRADGDGTRTHTCPPRLSSPRASERAPRRRPRAAEFRPLLQRLVEEEARGPAGNHQGLPSPVALGATGVVERPVLVDVSKVGRLWDIFLGLTTHAEPHGVLALFLR